MTISLNIILMKFSGGLACRYLRRETGFSYYADCAWDKNSCLTDCESTCQMLGIPVFNNQGFLKLRVKIEAAHDRLEVK